MHATHFNKSRDSSLIQPNFPKIKYTGQSPLTGQLLIIRETSIHDPKDKRQHKKPAFIRNIGEQGLPYSTLHNFKINHYLQIPE